MIDVPVPVKNALRDGRLKKNYRFVVSRFSETEQMQELFVYEDEGDSYTAPDDMSPTWIDPTHEEGANLGHCSKYRGGVEYESIIYNGRTIDLQTGDVLVVNIKNYQAPITLGLLGMVEEWTDVCTIDNDTLISESVNIDERMCSGDSIKFGLCEGSSLEFQYFNHPNITGCRVQAFVDVQYGSGVNDWQTIPMGFFTVEKCSRQASTGIMKVTAYNKLMSQYLDAKANELIDAAMADSSNWEYVPETLGNLLTVLLDDYSVERAYDVLNTSADCYIMALSGADVKQWTTAGGDILAALEVAIEYTTTDYSSVIQGLTKFAFDMDTLKELVIDNCPYKNTMIVVDGVTATWKNIYYGTSSTLGPLTIAITHQTGSNYRKVVKAYDGGAYSSPYIKNVRADTSYHGLFNVTTIVVPAYFKTFTSGQIVTFSDAEKAEAIANAEAIAADLGAQLQRQVDQSAIEDYDISSTTWSDVTLRDLQTAVFETNCQFGQLSRITDLFSGVELNRSRLYPADTLYPATTLYPDGAAESAFRSQYSKLWADEGNIHKWRYLIITYKGLDGDGNETDYTLQRTINADGTDDYNMSDNWLFRNLVWTASDIGDYADAMVPKMQDITWFPFEMWCAGLPYLETGDEIEIPLNGESYTSYVLQRQLKGIQNLQDTYINGTLDIF